MRNTVVNEANFNEVLALIESLMAKGSQNLSQTEQEELRALAVAVQKFEKSIYTIPPPTTLEGIIELKMYELRLKQNELAKILGVSEAKFSLIMNHKQKPDVAFLKALHKELQIDGNQLLELV